MTYISKSVIPTRAMSQWDLVIGCLDLRCGRTRSVAVIMPRFRPAGSYWWRRILRLAEIESAALFHERLACIQSAALAALFLHYKLVVGHWCVLAVAGFSSNQSIMVWACVPPVQSLVQSE